MIVSHEVLRAGYSNAISLEAFTHKDAATIVPFDNNDPALPYLGAYEPDILLDASPKALMDRLSKDRWVTWGVWHDRRLTGVASQMAGEEGESVYSIYLAAGFRGRGIGTLATAAVVHATFTDGLLHNVSSDFNQHIPSIETSIHPKNQRSAEMCIRAGFVFVGFRRQSIKGRTFDWNDYILPNPRAGGLWPMREEQRQQSAYCVEQMERKYKTVILA